MGIELGTWQDAMNSSLHLHHCEKYGEYILSGGVYRLVIILNLWPVSGAISGGLLWLVPKQRLK